MQWCCHNTAALLRCLQAEMPSLAAGIATTRQADIVVGPHGANLANSWLLRPGSSAIELRMYQFEQTHAHNTLPWRNSLVSRDSGGASPRLLEVCGPGSGLRENSACRLPTLSVAGSGPSVVTAQPWLPICPLLLRLSAGCGHAGAVLEAAAV
jgi:hypothetical protein